MNTKLNSAAGTLGALTRAIPLGTSTLMILSALFLLISFFHPLVEAGETAGNLELRASDWGVFNIPAFLFNQLVSRNVWLWLLSVITFPLAGAGIEQEIGTFQFLWLFEILGLITSSLYIVITNILGIVYGSWRKDGVVGMDIAFFTLITIEGLYGRGLYEIASRRGLVIAREFFFLPWFVIFMVAMLILPPGKANILPHLAAVIVGCMRMFVAIDLML